MWEQFLKNTQTELLVPPGFTKIQVRGANKANYTITLKRALKEWGFVSGDGVFTKQATWYDVYNTLKRYPKFRGCFFECIGDSWLIYTDTGGIVRTKFYPETDTLPLPMTPTIMAVLGGVVCTLSFDYRDMQPWYVDTATALLHEEDILIEPPTYLAPAQQCVYRILAEQELANRVPDTEKKIKDMLTAEGANLAALQETSDGYSIRFRYRGRMRTVDVREDLVLTNAHMCLEGTDKNHSLDSFMSILQYEDSGEFGHPIYY